MISKHIIRLFSAPKATSRSLTLSVSILLQLLVVFSAAAKSTANAADADFSFLSEYNLSDSLSLQEKLWEEIAKSLGVDGKNGEGDGQAPHKLPIGIAKRINGAIYVVALDDMRFTPQGAYIRAYTSVEIPGTNTPLAFSASNVNIGTGGISAKQTKLMLVSDHTIKLSQHISIVVDSKGGNYIEWDCNGFKAINLKGYIEFSPQLIVTAETSDTPYADGTLPPQGVVRASFEVHAESLHDLIFYANMPAFKTKAGGPIFKASRLCVDLSDTSNPQGMIFPEGYLSGYSIEDKALWRGFYAEELSITLPKELSGSREQPLSISAKGLIIDNMGVSITAEAQHIMGEANADGWPFTIEGVKVSFLKNQLVGGGLNGVLQIPMLAYDTLAYTAEVYEGKSGWDYSFAIATGKDREFSMDALSATLKLGKGSSVKLEKKEGSFTASAVLNGKLSIANPILSVNDVIFERLSLTSRAPYLTDGVIELSSSPENKVGSFPIALTRFKLDINAGSPKLHVGVSVNFMDSKGFSGSTNVIIHSKHSDSESRLSWKVDKVEVETVQIECNLGAFGFNGSISFYKDDPVYGNGFGGKIKMDLTELLKDIEAEVNFGKKDDFRYWQASVQIPTRIPIPPLVGLTYITSLKGGLAYKMRKELPKPEFWNTDGGNKPDKYIPDGNTGLSFLAGAGLTFGEAVVSAKLQLEVCFLKSGGLSYIAFEGDAAFLTLPDQLMASLKNVDITKEDNPQTAPLSVRMRMTFNNEEKIFSANLKTYLNVLGLVKGKGPNNLVGESVIYLSEKDWYIYIGRPSVPNAISIVGMFEASSYFMMGTKLENMPVPPAKVTEVVGTARANTGEISDGMKNAKGFGLGLRFDTSCGVGQNGGFVYAFIELGAGADILLRQLKNTTCKGRSGPIGIDGWYASGQAYAYLGGAVGIRVKKKKFDILSLRVAALLEAEAFNPVWIRGSVGAKYSVLGGLVKGTVNVKFELGDKCEIVSSGSDLGVDIIADMLPAKGEGDVSVFAAPQVAFNTPIGVEFGMMNQQNTYEQYRVALDELQLSSQSGVVGGEVVWSTDRNVAIISTHDVLPGKSNMRLNVKVHVEKKEGSKGWEVFKDEDGSTSYESKETTFATGEAPDYIPEGNVLYAYPIKNQYNFYPEEYGKGYIQLKKGQPDVFANLGNELEYVVKFSNPGKQVVEAAIDGYDAGKKTVNFNIPRGIQAETLYSMSIVRRIKSAGGAIDQNLVKETKTVNVGGEGEVAEVADNKLAGGEISGVGEKSVYDIHLRTSKYGTFTAKLNAIISSMQGKDIVDEGVYTFGLRLNMLESLDEFEQQGQLGSFEPLVTAEAIPTGPWYDEFTMPVMYNLYGKGDTRITTSRDITEYGIPPLKAVLVYNSMQKQYRITNEHIAQMHAPAIPGIVIVNHIVTIPAFTDFMSMKSKVANLYINQGLQGAPENVQRLVARPGFIDMKKGSYKVNLQYRLPGTGHVTSKKEFTLIF